MLKSILDNIIWMFIEMAPYIMLGMLFIILLNFFFSKRWVLRHIGKDNLSSVIKASLFGIPLPLCSCGVVPTAIFLDKNGASKSSSVSFLISTPQTGIDSIFATYGMMGPVFAVFRPFAALVMGVVGGLAVKVFNKPEKKKFDPKNINFNVINNQSEQSEQEEEKLTVKEKIKKSFRYDFVEFMDTIAFRFIIGVVISGLIAYFLPDDFFGSLGLTSNLWAMLLMIAIGIPMYICATASIPIAVVLIMKGFSPGVAFVFLAAGPVVNAASIAIVVSALGRRVTTIYILSIIVLSIVMGYVLDYFYEIFEINPLAGIAHIHEHHNHLQDHNWFFILTSFVFLVLLITSIYRKYIRRYFIKPDSSLNALDNFMVTGMTCQNCANNVRETLETFPGIKKVIVKLEENRVYVDGDYDKAKVESEISKIGYKVKYNQGIK